MMLQSRYQARWTTAIVIAVGLTAGAAQAHEIDFKDSAPARRAAEVLRDLGSGNARSAGWEYLTLDLKDGTMRGKAWIRNRHVTIRKPIKIVAYNWKVSVSFQINPRDGNMDGEIDFGRGIRIRKSAVASVLSAVD